MADPTVVQGVRSLADMSSNREDTSFAMGIALLDASESPITSITMKMERTRCKTRDHHWFEDELVPDRDQVNGAVSTTATSLTVDNGTRFAVGDVVRVNETGEQLLVVDRSGNDLEVLRDFGQSSEDWTTKADDISDNGYLTVIGNAFEKGHPIPTIRSTTEVEYENFTQDIRTPTGMTESDIAAAHRGTQDWPFQLRKTGLKHQRKLELTNIWGKPNDGKSGAYDADSSPNEDPTTAGGINHFIEEYAPSDNKVDQDELTMDEFLDFLEVLFHYGSSTKWIFCDAKLRTALDKWGISKLNTFERTKVLGMAITRWNSSHGDVVFVTHRRLENPETNGYRYAFALDMEVLKHVTYSNIGSTRLRRLKPYEATGETIQKVEYQTIQCIEFGEAAKHGRLRWKSVA